MTPITIIFIIVGLSVIIMLIFIIKNLFYPHKNSKVQELYNQGKYSNAIKISKRILSKEPGNNAIRYTLGISYLKIDEKSKALEELKKVSIAGNFTGVTNEFEYRNLIADLFLSFNQPKEALKEFILLIKIDPENEKLYYKVGCLFSQLNKIENAIIYLKKTIKINPQHPHAHFQLGKLYFQLKKLEEAENELNLSTRYNINDYSQFFYLGKIYKEKNDFKKAIIAFENSQRNQEFKVKSLLERGLCHINLKNVDLAIIDFERAIALASQKEDEIFFARYYLAYCFEEKRNIDKALEQWEEIFSKKPSFKDVGKKLSNYKELRNDDKMKDYLTTGDSDFIELCKQITSNMNVSIREIEIIQNGCQIIGIETDKNKQITKKEPVILWFLRLQEFVSENLTRTLYEEMKRLGIHKGIILTNTNFAEDAIIFAEGRPIDFFRKNKLQKLLQRI